MYSSNYLIPDKKYIIPNNKNKYLDRININLPIKKLLQVAEEYYSNIKRVPIMPSLSVPSF
jgi:hypothetical protein